MPRPQTFSYVSQGLRLNVCDWGDPDAPPLLLIHGGRDHARSWDAIAERLSDRYRVLAPDLRGHGDSDWAAGGVYPPEAFTLDLAELIDGLPPLVIIGHSLGGAIGLRLAALYPEKVRRIVAIEGLGYSPRHLAERPPPEKRLADWIARLRATGPPRRYASLEQATARLAAEHPRLEARDVADLARHGVRAHEDGTVSFKHDPALRAFFPVEPSPEDGARLWARVACPALLVYGAQSWASSPAEDGRARHFQNAEVVTLDGAGHWAQHDQREAFMAHVERFLG